MIAVDTNVLVYAHRQDSSFHEPARRELDRLASGRAPWAIAWPCLHEFFGIVTHPRIYVPPTSPTQADEQVRAWLDSPSLTMISETPSHWATMSALITGGYVFGPVIHDARIAAICLSNGVTEILTLDRDFERFVGLKVRSLPHQ